MSTAPAFWMIPSAPTPVGPFSHATETDGWVFLTGQKDDIELLRHRLGFWDIDPAVDADPEQHLGTVRIANEPMHRWAMSPSLLNPPALVRAVHRVFPEFV